MIFPITIAKKGGVPQFQTNPDRIKWVKYLPCISTLYDQKMCGMFTWLGLSPQSPTNQLIPHIYLININIITIESILQHEFEVQKSSPSARFGALQSYQRGVFGKSERINSWTFSRYLPQCFRNAMECRKTWHTSAIITVIWWFFNFDPCTTTLRVFKQLIFHIDNIKGVCTQWTACWTSPDCVWHFQDAASHYSQGLSRLHKIRETILVGALLQFLDSPCFPGTLFGSEHFLPPSSPCQKP